MFYLILTIKKKLNYSRYTDLRDKQVLVVSNHGATYYDQQYTRDFTVNIYYEGEKANEISRTWRISGEF